MIFPTSIFAGRKADQEVRGRSTINLGITDDNRIRPPFHDHKILPDGGSVILMSSGARMTRRTNAPFVGRASHLQLLLGGTPVLLPTTVSANPPPAPTTAESRRELCCWKICVFTKEEKRSRRVRSQPGPAGCIRQRCFRYGPPRPRFRRSSPNFPGKKNVFGLLMEGEVASAEKVLHAAESPLSP